MEFAGILSLIFLVFFIGALMIICRRLENIEQLLKKMDENQLPYNRALLQQVKEMCNLLDSATK